MSRWTVHRVWRNVKAETATEAIENAQPGEHDEVRAAAQWEHPDAMALLYYTRQELEALQLSVGAMLLTTEENREYAQTPSVQTLLATQWNVLNSLRTSLAEARYGLMGADEIAAERDAQAKARAAGIIS